MGRLATAATTTTTRGKRKQKKSAGDGVGMPLAAVAVVVMVLGAMVQEARAGVPLPKCQATGSNWDMEDTIKTTLMAQGSCPSKGKPYGGAVVGYTDLEDGFSVLEGVGWARKDTMRNCPYETIHPWASLSKSVTGVIAANLAMEGKLNLDVDIGEYLNSELYGMSYSRPKRWVRCSNTTSPDGPMARSGCPEFGIVDSVPLSFEDAFITTRMLLAHRAGYPDWPSSYVLTWQDNQLQWVKSFTRPAGRLDPQNVNHNMTWSVKTGDMQHINLVGKPGAGYLYSNIGFDVAGAILEIASGLSFDKLTEKYVAKPLGLQTLHTLRENTNNPTEAIGYGDSVGTNCAEIGFTRDAAFHAAGGGHASTLNDLHKYATALASFDTRLLPTWASKSKGNGGLNKLGFVPSGKDARTIFWEQEPISRRWTRSGYGFGINRVYRITPESPSWPSKASDHWKQLQSAQHGGSWTSVVSDMDMLWGASGAGSNKARVFTMMSNSKIDTDRTGTSLTSAIKSAIVDTGVPNGQAYTSSIFPAVTYGRDKSDPLCQAGCGQGHRKFTAVARVPPSGLKTLFPDQKNHPVQNQPLTFDLVFNDQASAPMYSCQSGHSVDAILDPKGRDSQIIETDKVLNKGIGGLVNRLPTRRPNNWLVDNYRRFSDSSVKVEAYDAGKWAKYRNDDFFPLQIQGLSRRDGTTCFMGVWARRSGTNADDFSIQTSVDPSDVDLHAQGKIPTSVSVYHNPKTEKLESTVVWRKERTKGESKKYWIPRVRGSTALTYAQFLSFYRTNFKRCRLYSRLVYASGGGSSGITDFAPAPKKVTTCECWMPILVDAYTAPDGRDYYISVWKRAERVNTFAKIRMPEAEFHDYVRRAACSGYKVMALTRYRHSTYDDGFFVTAIFQKLPCLGDLVARPTLNKCIGTGIGGFKQLNTRGLLELDEEEHSDANEHTDTSQMNADEGNDTSQGVLQP